MSRSRDGKKERQDFYSKATHILFAVVLGHSFLLAPDVIIPIYAAFEPNNHTAVMYIMFAYVVIVAGWIGYARSVSRHPHQDTGWGVARFALGIVILFEYFYLIRISQTEYVGHIPWVMVALFVTYMLSDWLKIKEYGTRYKKRFKRRMYDTWRAVVASIFLLLISIGMDTDAVTIGLFTLLVLLFSVAKWRPHTNTVRTTSKGAKKK